MDECSALFLYQNLRMNPAIGTEPEAGNRHRAEVKPESFYTQGVRSRLESGDLNETAMPAGLFPNGCRVTLPHLFPIEEDACPADGFFTKDLNAHGIILPIGRGFDPIAIPPNDAVEPVRDRFIGIRNVDTVRRCLVLRIGMSDDSWR